jgi:hypothetical protein
MGKAVLIAFQKEATNTIGCPRKQAEEEWFDEEYEKANEEKKSCKVKTVQKLTRTEQIKTHPFDNVWP